MMIYAHVYLCSHLGHVMTIGVNSDTVKAYGIGSTTTTLMVPPHPVSSGKRTITTAGSGRSTEAWRQRWSATAWVCLKTCLDFCFFNWWPTTVCGVCISGSVAEEWKEESGRTEKLHPGVDAETRASQRLAHAPEPGEASGPLSCLFTMAAKVKWTFMIICISLNGHKILQIFMLESLVITHCHLRLSSKSCPMETCMCSVGSI